MRAAVLIVTGLAGCQKREKGGELLRCELEDAAVESQRDTWRHFIQNTQPQLVRTHADTHVHAHIHSVATYNHPS